MNYTDLSSRTKSAVSSIECPELEFGIHARIARQRSRHNDGRSHSMLAVAGFASMLAVGLLLSFQTGTLHHTAASQERFIASISTNVPVAFRAGLQDHVHCAVFRKLPAKPPTRDALMTALGPRFAGLIPIVEQHMPASFHIVAAHQCQYLRSRFIHLTLTDGQRVMSVVLSPNSGQESVNQAGRAAAAEAGGFPVFTARSNRYQIAAFESAPYIAYVVSDLPASQNLQIAAAVAPLIGRLLS